MTDFFTNVWTVGIGSSLIVFMITFFISRLFLRKQLNKEYQQKIQSANNEIIFSTRPWIVEKKQPSSQIIESLYYSTAKKYDVFQNDLLSFPNITKDLIKEIYDTPFLTHDQKIDLAFFINELKESLIPKTTEVAGTKAIEESEKVQSEKKKNNSAFLGSFIVSFTVTAVTFFFITKDYLFKFFNKSNSDNFEIQFIIGLFIAAPIGIVLGLLLKNKLIGKVYKK